MRVTSLIFVYGLNPTLIRYEVVGSLMNNDPDVKHHVLQLCSHGHSTGLQWTNAGEWVSGAVYIKWSCPFADISRETDLSYMEEADEWLYMVLSVRPVLC